MNLENLLNKFSHCMFVTTKKEYQLLAYSSSKSERKEIIDDCLQAKIGVLDIGFDKQCGKFWARLDVSRVYPKE